MPAHEGRAAIGLKVHHKQLWVAGGPTGKAFVYDARTGADVAEYALATGTPFINDVAIGRREAYFTNSRAAEVFAVALRGGPVAPHRPHAATSPRPATRRPPTSTGSPSRAGTRCRSCSRTPASSSPPTRGPASARAIDLGGADVLNGDGILLRGRTLFVVQNRLNQIAVIHLSRDLARGRS